MVQSQQLIGTIIGLAIAAAVVKKLIDEPSKKQGFDTRLTTGFKTKKLDLRFI